MIGLLAAVFLPWISSSYAGVLQFSPSLTDMMMTPSARAYGGFVSPGDATILFGGIVFLGGAVISFITPLGGIPQIAGWILLFSTVSQILGTHIGHPGILYDTYLGLGFWAGLFAGALCTLSILIPIGLGQSWKALSFKGRLLTLRKDL